MKRSGYRVWAILFVLCGAACAGAERGIVAETEAAVHRQRAGLEETLAWLAERAERFPTRRLERARILALESKRAGCGLHLASIAGPRRCRPV